MPRQIIRNLRNSGFTLVEVLVATLITALVMIAIIGTLMAGMSGRDTVYNLSQEQSAGIAVLGLIEKDLHGIFLYNIASKRVFLGTNKSVRGQEADTLDMVTTTDSKIPIIRDEHAVKSDLCEVGYHLRSNPQKSDFLEIWRRESFFVDDKPFEGGTYTLLYDQVKSFNITYYTEPGPQAEELQEWSVEDKGSFPYSMKIEMEVELRPRWDKETSSSLNPPKRTIKFTRNILFSPTLNQALKLAVVPIIPEKAPDLEGLPGGPAGKSKSGNASQTTGSGSTSGSGSAGGSGSGGSAPTQPPKKDG